MSTSTVRSCNSWRELLIHTEGTGGWFGGHQCWVLLRNELKIQVGLNMKQKQHVLALESPECGPRVGNSRQ